MDYYATAHIACSTGRPYTVATMEAGDFFNYKFLVTQFVRNRNKCETGEQANWLKMKVLKYHKSASGTTEFADDYDGPFHRIIVNSGTRARRPTVLPADVPKL